jgi:hypothetical protein
VNVDDDATMAAADTKDDVVVVTADILRVALEANNRKGMIILQ